MGRLAKMGKMETKVARDPSVLLDHLECLDQEETLGYKAALVHGGQRA